MKHDILAKAWVIYNGQKGTQKQIERIKKVLNEETLERMLRERGVQIA